MTQMMNQLKHPTRAGRAATAAAALALLGACGDPTVPDLNNPGRAEYETITDRSQLQALATGLVDGDRDAYGTQVTFSEIVGRDLYRFDPAESRYITNLLGTTIDPSNFIGSGMWTIPYSNLREARLIVSAVNASTNALPRPLTDAEKAASRGYALTLGGLQYIRLVETRDVRGVPIQGATAADLTPISCKPGVLTYTSALLDSAATELRTAGAIALPFTLPPGFAGFTTADAASGTDFLAFNRGLKAKVEMYRGFLPLQTASNPLATPDAAALTAALTALDQSFYNPTGTRAAMDAGVYHTYAAAAENSNPLVDVSVFRANPRVISEGAEPGDIRIATKLDTLSSNRTLANGSGTTAISSRYIIRFPATPSDKLGLLKNGELVLNRALILWGLQRDAEAIQMINLVRQAAGLPARTAANFATRRDLLNAILKEKRYELLFESPSRLVDYRMLGIINDLGQERGQNPIATFPIPNHESVARNGNVTCQ